MFVLYSACRNRVKMAPRARVRSTSTRAAACRASRATTAPSRSTCACRSRARTAELVCPPSTNTYATVRSASSAPTAPSPTTTASKLTHSFIKFHHFFKCSSSTLTKLKNINKFNVNSFISGHFLSNLDKS